MNAINIYYIVVVWFLFIALTCGKKYPSAAILFLAATTNLIIVHGLKLFESMNYLDTVLILIKYDGALALIMTMIMRIDKHAWKHALILAFAVVCHSMISLYLITDSSQIESISFLFYEYYDELIIMTALLQMVVSLDGMAQGLDNLFRRIQGMFFSFVFHSNRICKSLSTQKKIKGRT